jgi:L-alanine-DL-glutamate epimerase-like enolase superfamily enzyme
MKITKISTTAVTVPVEPPESIYKIQEKYAGKIGSKKPPTWLTPGISPHDGINRRATRMFKNGIYSIDYVFVTIETDDGLTGIGESATDIGFFGESLEAVKFGIDNYLAPGLIGMDPFDRELILAKMCMSHARQLSAARSGIDMALHDLLGKALNVPVSSLIGGRRQDKVLVAIEVAAPTPEDLAELCVGYVKQGVRAFKLKMHGYPDEDIAKIKAVREAVGDKITIRSDANQGYTVKEAIEVCDRAEKLNLGLELMEQPIAEWDLDGMAMIRNSVKTLIEADEAAYSMYDVMEIIKKGAADVILLKIGKAGGLYNVKKISAVAEAAGMQCVIGTEWGLGLKVAAKLQLATSTLVRDAVEFSEIFMHDMLLAPPNDTIFGLPLKDGFLSVPTGPGLGIALDEAKVNRYISEI